MNRVVLILLFFFFIAKVSSQVTIGSGTSPEKAALLQLKDSEPDTENVTSKTGGLLLPRVKLENKSTLMPFIPDDDDFKNNVDNVKDKHKGLVVYNMSTSAGFETGAYIWDGTEWILYKGNATADSPQDKFFYMPSFNIVVAGVSQDNYYPIYGEYQAQFEKAGMYVYPADKIEFRVTHNDPSVIDNISFPAEYGNMYMKYDILSATAPAGSFLNIIIVVK
ncbi:MAG: hypothetical protein ACK5KL_09130 [Dysgonomonas sp.]